MTGSELAIIIPSGVAFFAALFGYLKHIADLRYLRKERKAGARLPELTEALDSVNGTTPARVASDLSKVLLAWLGRRDRETEDQFREDPKQQHNSSRRSRSVGGARYGPGMHPEIRKATRPHE